MMMNNDEVTSRLDKSMRNTRSSAPLYLESLIGGTNVQLVCFEIVSCLLT